VRPPFTHDCSIQLFLHCCAHAAPLAGLVETKSNNVGVDHGQVEGGKEEIRVGKRHEHGTVHRWVTLVNLTRGLVGVTLVLAGDGERSVGEVQLRHPSDERGGTGRGGGDVRAVGSNGLARHLPSHVDELAGEGERLRAVVGNGRGARVARVFSSVDVRARLILGEGGVRRIDDAVADNLVGRGVVGRPAVGVGLVHKVKGREVLPRQTSGVLGARADVGCKVSPSPRLGDTGLEPDGHGVKTKHLAEGHLLASLRSNGLRKQLSNLTGIEVVDEAPNTRLAEASELLVEVDEFANRGEWVVVRALWGSSLAEHVAQQGGVASFLDSHKRNVIAVLSSETLSKEIFGREGGETVVEQIKLDPFLVQTKSDGLVVKVAVDLVARLSAIGTKTTCES
jgi:hypothetical protein